MDGERWPRAHAESLLTAWEKSGQKMGDFARERGLEVSRLYYWRRLLRREKLWATKKQERNPRRPRLVPVVVSPARQASTVHTPCAVAWSSCSTEGQPDPEWLARFVRALVGAAGR